MNEIVRKRIDLLCPLLKDSGPVVRTAAAAAIERLEGLNGLDEILATLTTGSRGERVSAVRALGIIGGERVVEPLVQCAGRPEEDIRAAAVEELGRLAVPETLPVLLGRVNDPNTAVQARAIAALGNFPPSPAICARLHPFLNANDGALEAEAVISLARLADQTILAVIPDLLASPHDSTRQAAATALGLLPLQ